MTKETIGFIGLGKMGLPIARRLAAAGHRIIAWAHSERSVDTADAEGFGSQADLAELSRRCSVLIAAVPALYGLFWWLDYGWLNRPHDPEDLQTLDEDLD